MMEETKKKEKGVRMSQYPCDDAKNTEELKECEEEWEKSVGITG